MQQISQGNSEPALGFRLGFVPGTTPGKWAKRWAERFPRQPLELVPLPLPELTRALAANQVDAALTYLPVDKDQYHAIPLYQERAVVVVPKDHLYAALADDEPVPMADLADETVFAPADSALAGDLPGRPLAAYAADGSPDLAAPPPQPSDAKAAMEWVAAGTGLTVLPMSLARLHHRKDVTYRPVNGLAGPQVALVWSRRADGPQHQELAGIVRGRTANSSRGQQGQLASQISEQAKPSHGQQGQPRQLGQQAQQGQQGQQVRRDKSGHNGNLGHRGKAPRKPTSSAKRRGN